MSSAVAKSSEVPRGVKVVGFYCAVLTVVLTVLTWGIAFFTPPLSGPFCRGGCFLYPYADIATRFPRDYLWMYPAMVQLLVFAALMVAIHRYGSPESKVFSHLGLGLTMISVGALLLDYFVQVSVVQPSLLAGERDAVAMLTQFNPHGLFIALEDFGYSLMSAALLCMAPVFPGPSRVERALRWTLVGSFVLTLVSFALISATHGIHREYRFEVAVISIDWLALIVAGALLAVLFRRSLKTAERPSDREGNGAGREAA